MNNRIPADQLADTFCKLGKYLNEYTLAENHERLRNFSKLHDAVIEANRSNPWFTFKNIETAFMAWADVLTPESLGTWMSRYPQLKETARAEQCVAVIMAGNIPLVGMHDFISTILCGHVFLGKLSKNDKFLLPAIADYLITLEPGLRGYIQFTSDHLTNYDAVIATGSNNTSRYFEYYFSKIPHIIRNSRNGVAILNGNESEAKLLALGDDICQYFGLGCRSVSKIYVPLEFDILKILSGCEPHFADFTAHHKYMNNYLYQKTIHQMNLIPFAENGSMMMVQHESIASPISVVHFEYYQEKETLLSKLSEKHHQIQCIISTDNQTNNILPGKAQQPDLWDYADGIDTVQFLLSLTA